MGWCRRPDQCINFIVAHDGFTLHDLCAYNDKHNDANGEGNRDGTNDNFSWNCGVEGDTSDEGAFAKVSANIVALDVCRRIGLCLRSLQVTSSP